MSAGAASAMGIVSGFGATSKNDKNFSSSGGWGSDVSYVDPNRVPHLANGGIISDATYALIGEKSYPEAVIPLRSSVLESIAGFMYGNEENQNVSSAVMTFNNYGDINTGSDYEEFMGDVNSVVAAGMRGVRIF